MNNYQVINNAVACIKDECAEIEARGVNAEQILTALRDGTEGATPFDYNLSQVKEEVANYQIKFDFLDDILRDINRNIETVSIRQRLLKEDREYVYNVIGCVVGPNLRSEIADKLLANGISVERD